MKNTYIHFTRLNLETIESIFKYGIMSKQNQIKNGIYGNCHEANNGKYFVSLTKKTKQNKSIYNVLIKNQNYIGIKVKLNKEPIKAKSTNLEILNMTSLPIRYSPYNDEWQTKEILTKDKFIALHYPLNILEKECHNEKELNDIKNILEEIKNLMKTYDIDIPLITEKTYTK